VNRSLEWTITSVEEGTGEGYWAQCEGGRVWIRGESPLGARYGQAQFALAHQQGRIGECLGNQTPSLPIRALWSDSPPREIEPLLQCSINTVIAGRHQVTYLRQEGMKIWRIIIEEIVEEESDGFIVTGRAPQAAGDKNRFERVVEEMMEWRARIPSHLPLVYRFNPRPDLAPWYASRLEPLLDQTPEGVSVVFDGRGVIWDALRRSPDSSSTPLLPIVAPGEVEGLLTQPFRHPVQGMILRLSEGDSLSEIASRLRPVFYWTK
jgi:hypothetical protein